MKVARTKKFLKIVLLAMCILVLFAVLALIIPSSRNAIFQRFEALQTEARLTKTYEHKQRYNEPEFNKVVCAALIPECGYCPTKGVVHDGYCYWNGALLYE